jgi:hypothetical protein
MTTEAEVAVTAVTALDSEFRRLALLASRGDKNAEAELIKVERRIEEIHRRERRDNAAAAEAQRQEVLAQEQENERGRQAKMDRKAKFVEQREAAFAQIEAATAELAEGVTAALAVDREVWAMALQLEQRPEMRTAARITDFIAWKLGRNGGAGLGDMPAVPTPLRQPLTTARVS